MGALFDFFGGLPILTFEPDMSLSLDEFVILSIAKSLKTCRLTELGKVVLELLSPLES